MPKFTWIEKLASAIYNDIMTGLSGITPNMKISMEQLEDEIVNERLAIIKEYLIKGILPLRDLYDSLTCLDVDCKPIEKCGRCAQFSKYPQTEIAHVEIPQLMTILGAQAIDYFGTIDRNTPFKVYMDISFQFHKYNRWLGDKPFVYIDTTPNENNMYDCYIFNAPLLKTVTVVGIFKDPRQLIDTQCCGKEIQNFNSLTNDIQRRLTEKKFRFYRSLPNTPTLDNGVIKP